MTKATPQSFTFIPFVADPRLKQERALLEAKARSHIAVINHQRSRKRHHHDAKVSALNDPRHIRPPERCTRAEVDIADSTTHGKTYPFGAAPDPQQTFFNDTSSTSRTIDWYFGSLGSENEIEDFDAVAFQFFGDLNQSHSSQTFSTMGIFVRESIQRAVGTSFMLPSLAASMAFEMARVNDDGGFAKQKRLSWIGRECNAKALQRLQHALKCRQHFDMISLYSGVAHLCIAAIVAGDLDAATAHLGYLRSLAPHLDPESGYYHILLGSIFCVDLRHSMETGTRPLIDSLGPMQPHTSVVTTEHLETIHEQWKTHDQTYWEDTLAAKINLEIPGPGFYWAVELETLTTTIHEITPQYFQATGYDFRHILRNNADYLKSLRFNYTRTLYLICIECSTIVEQIQACERDTDSGDIRQTLSQAVLIAFQIHLVLRQPVRGLSQALPYLACRLRKSVDRLYSWSKIDLSSAKTVLDMQLHLWIFITGMIGAKDTPQLRLWFQESALRMATLLRLQNEVDARNALAAFDVRGDAIGEEVSKFAKLLAIDHRSLGNKM